MKKADEEGGSHCVLWQLITAAPQQHTLAVCVCIEGLAEEEPGAFPLPLPSPPLPSLPPSLCLSGLSRTGAPARLR